MQRALYHMRSSLHWCHVGSHVWSLGNSSNAALVHTLVTSPTHELHKTTKLLLWWLSLLQSCLPVMQHTAELLPLLMRLLQQWRTATPEPVRAWPPFPWCQRAHAFPGPCQLHSYSYWSRSSQGMPLYMSSDHVIFRKQSRHASTCLPVHHNLILIIHAS